ncbi:MAG TPA: hypothetical protein VG708_01330 [Mycobacteriales bacterium]|nr:hypothetical protein [Mycobacteriales bacterium]
MPGRPARTLPGSLIAALAAAIVGVFALDATTIVAAPAAPAAHATTTTTSTQPGTLGTPNLRILRWSGYNWLVFPPDQAGPERGIDHGRRFAVTLSDSPKSAYVDSRGRLHLHIIHTADGWKSVELRLLAPISYGTFRMVVDSPVAKFSKNTVLGMFVYQPGSPLHQNEIDIEDSQFTTFLGPRYNAQYVVQPYYTQPTAPHWYKYFIPAKYTPLLQQFTWLPGQASFLTRVGRTTTSPLFTQHHYAGRLVPVQSADHPLYLYLDLWLNKDLPPTDGTHSVVLHSFRFLPPTPPSR